VAREFCLFAAVIFGLYRIKREPRESAVSGFAAQ